jgi:two-component system, chemotaxis family, protein-glutamate methylesterase/glutaminase
VSSRDRRLRVLVADDSSVARRLLVHVLDGDPGLAVVGEAADGRQAVQETARLRPDVLVMDVLMPHMDGFEATRRVMEATPTPIVLVSAGYEPTDVTRSFEALHAGALTLLPKPRAPQAPGFADDCASLTVTVKLLADVKLVRRRPPQPARPARPAPARPAGERRVAVVAIAASTGGPAALATLLGGLPERVPVPVLVVQHIASGFHQGLVDWLASVSPLPVRLAADGQPLLPGEVLVAPDDRHLGVTASGRVALSDDPPIGGHRPSATHLFRSVAEAHGPGAVGVILTGMGADGVAGLQALKALHGTVLAQDEATSVVFGMPGEAVAMGLADRVLPVTEIAGAIGQTWNGA